MNHSMNYSMNHSMKVRYRAECWWWAETGDFVPCFLFWCEWYTRPIEENGLIFQTRERLQALLSFWSHPISSDLIPQSRKIQARKLMKIYVYHQNIQGNTPSWNRSWMHLAKCAWGPPQFRERDRHDTRLDSDYFGLLQCFWSWFSNVNVGINFNQSIS
jgi:hypothetical protein